MSLTTVLFKAQNTVPYYQAAFSSSTRIGIVSTPIVDFERILYLPGFYNKISASDQTTTLSRLMNEYSFDNGQTWGSYTDAATSVCGTNTSTNVRTVVDSNGTFHNFVNDFNTSVLKHWTYNGTSWVLVASYTLTLTGVPTQFVVQMGLNNIIHLLVADRSGGSNATIRYATVTAAGVLSAFTTVLSTDGNVASIAIDMYVDTAGVAHMVFANGITSGTALCKYAKSSSIATVETVLDGSVDSGSIGAFVPKLVCDSFGYVHVFAILSGVATTSFSGTYYSYRDLAGVWHQSALHARGLAGGATDDNAWLNPSITKDGSNNIYISFKNATNYTVAPGMWMAKRAANLGSWDADAVITAGGSASTDFVNIGFFNPSSYPLNGTVNGYGIPTLGCRGIFHSTGLNSTPANGYYLWGSSDLIPPALPGEVTEINCGVVGVAVSSVANLSHLEGMTVSILANGEVQPQQVVTNGAITLASSFTKVFVGLPYTSDIQPINAEIALPDGTLQGRQVNITKSVLKVWNSAGGYVGPDFDNLKLIKKLVRTGIQSLYTGDVKVVRGGGYQGIGALCIRQTDPLPITVCAIVMQIEPGGMINETND